MLAAQVQSGQNTHSASIAEEVVAAILNAGSPRKSPAAHNAAPTYRRGAERRMARATGNIAFSRQHIPLPCTLQDICDVGARLKVDDVNRVPEAFRLTIKRIGLATDCVVVWRSGSEVGVVFQSALEQARN